MPCDSSENRGSSPKIYMPPDVLANSGLLDQEEVSLFCSSVMKLCEDLRDRKYKLHPPTLKLIEEVLRRSCDCSSGNSQD